MKQWWLSRSLRVRLAAWYAVTGGVVWLVCLLVAVISGAWKPGTERNLLLTLAIGCPGAFLLCGFSGYLIAGRALAPVKEMVQRTRLLSAKSLSERLPV